MMPQIVEGLNSFEDTASHLCARLEALEINEFDFQR
jgi:hypothetical protein